MNVPRRPLVAFVAAILAVGVVRFVLTVSGVPDELTRFASMTVIILAGCIHFGLRGLTAHELLTISYALILPYMAIEVAGLGYTWATGRSTIFHSREYSFGMPIAHHFWGHVVGGLTWEPLALFLVMLVIRTIASAVRARRQGGEP